VAGLGGTHARGDPACDGGFAIATLRMQVSVVTADPARGFVAVFSTAREVVRECTPVGAAYRKPPSTPITWPVT